MFFFLSGVHQVREVLHVQRRRGGEDPPDHHERRDWERAGGDAGHPAG